ncbi:MAG: hypothetical protein K6G56_06620 [Clostridiales bacterium]|nr:hypothetical protein [Clostridiales bacterium]
METNLFRNIKTISKGRKTASWIVRAAAVAAAAAVFSVYLYKNWKNYDPISLLAAFLSIAGFAAVFWLAAPRLIDLICGDNEFSSAEVTIKERSRTFVFICIGALAIHIVTFLLGVFVFKWFNASPNATFAYCFRTSWMKSNTDAGHYITIAENWYVREGNDKLLIVFFPMLPVLMRALNFITRDSYVSALIINSTATALASGMIYLTFVPVMGDKRSKAGAFIALLLPGAIFLNSPMTEPLFLLFSACAFCFMQKRLYVPAGIFTALAGFTRSLGVLIAVPIALVGIGHLAGLIKRKRPIAKTLVLLLLGLLISTFGTLGYLAINYSIHGDCLKFFEFQWSNWHQKACPFFDTVRYITKYSMQNAVEAPPKFWSLWFPQLVCIFASLLLVGSKARKLPASYTVFFLCYFAVAVGCTWLLSSVRYLSACLPLIAAAAMLCNKKLGAAAVFSLTVVLYAVYLVMYMMRMSVY